MTRGSLPRLIGALVLASTPPLAAQTFRTDDPVIRQIWTEGMDHSQAERLAQVLLDSIGPRLSGSPAYASAVQWLSGMYQSWGIPVRTEQYGTWRGWRQGLLHVDLLAPRLRALEGHLLAWSPGTNGPIEGDVIAVPELSSPAEATAWLRSVRGKIVLASAPEAICREPQAFAELATAETVERAIAARRASQASWDARLDALGRRQAHRRLEDAGAIAVVTSRWSEGWGVNKVFSAATERAVSVDLSCEDYGLLYRLTSHDQGPRVRIDAQAEATGVAPMFNVIAELRGSELPDEYVLLGAHLDSWHAASGATDNGTGSVMMAEAMRILQAAYPHPRRTIIVGHWGGEEQGLIGSNAFAEDHQDIVDNVQVAFNQDNGTWRVDYIQAQGFSRAGGSLARWLGQIPDEIAQHIELDVPGPQERGGSDHMSFLCRGVPSFRFQSNYPDYRQYTWHTDRDTYDKIVFDDLKNNATLAAMMAYLASEDPERVPRDRSVLPPGANGTPRAWAQCFPARRAAN
ncbi:MAG TPA: M20/M25/M40 family metallo-hydrolase [Gemmatimonadales bacterium]